MTRRTIIFEFPVRSSYIFFFFWGGGGGGSGIGEGVRENNAYYFLLRMAHLLIFIHNGGI